MSRSCAQLAPPALDHTAPNAPDAIDVLWADSRLRFGSADNADPDIATYQSALVVARDTPDAHRSLLWLQSAIRGVDLRIIDSCPPGAVAHALGEARWPDCDIRTAVLVLNDAPPGIAQVQAMIDALREGPDTFTTIVVVASEPGRWAGLGGVNGCFATVPGNEARTAAQVFAALTSMGAPVLIDCLDVSEVLPVLGTFEAPSHVCAGHWMRGQQTLVMSSATDEDLLRCARALVSFVFPNGDSIASCERIRKTIRDVAARADYQVGSLPSRFLVPPVDGADSVPVIVLCSA